MKIGKLAIASSLCLSMAFGALLASAQLAGASNDTGSSAYILLAENQDGGSAPAATDQGKDQSVQQPADQSQGTATPPATKKSQDEGC